MPDKVDLNSPCYDDLGRIIATAYAENGKWFIPLVDYSTTPGVPTSYEIIGMVHTHPTGQAPDGKIYDTYNPSDDDKHVASVYTGLSQYIKTPKGSYGFDSCGAKRNQKLPNCNN